MAIASRCAEMTFSLTVEEGEEKMEGMDVFKYLVRPLEFSDN